MVSFGLNRRLHLWIPSRDVHRIYEMTCQIASLVRVGGPLEAMPRYIGLHWLEKVRQHSQD